MDEEVKEFINDRLFHQAKPVLFTDLISKFGIGPDVAKGSMFHYYKTVSDNAKFHCVVVCCLKDNRIFIVQDLAKIGQLEEDVIDCFIYAFSPTSEVIPYNEVYRQSEQTLTIKNSYELVHTETNGSSVTKAPVDKPIKRENGQAKKEQTPPTAPQKPKKDMGLRSTALLARMRKEREDKEQERQAELKRRREENAKRELDRDPKKAKQMDELSKMFDNDDDDDLMDIDDDENDNNAIKMEEHQDNRPATAPTTASHINESEMEDILDTTAEESLLEIKKDQKESAPEMSSQVEQTDEPVKKEQEPETYVDEDGYIVTRRADPKEKKATPPVKKTTPAVRAKTDPTPKPKRKQGTIESFFKRK